METKYAVTGGDGCNFCTHAAVFESNGNAVLSLCRSSFYTTGHKTAFQLCFNFYVRYTNIKTSAQNAPLPDKG